MWKKMITPILLVALAVVCFVSLPEIVLRPLGLSYLDNKAEEYYNNTMKNALVAYATARAINAGVSVIQDTEIEISPAGVGMSLALGEMLDPINDIIERFSWILLVSLSSLAIQRVILEIGQLYGLGTLLVFGFSILSLSYLLPNRIEPIVRNIALKIVVFGIALRLIIPLVGYVSLDVFGTFLVPVYNESISEMKNFESSVTDNQISPDSSPSNADEGWWEKLKNGVSSIRSMTELKKILNNVQSMAENQVRHIVNLLMVFVLQTIIIPITVLLFLKYIASSLFTTIAPLGAALGRAQPPSKGIAT